MLDKRLLILTAGMITVSWKSRIFLSGGCFSENMKNTPNATTTNSVVFHEREEVVERTRRSRPFNMHDTRKCSSVTQVNGLRPTSDYDNKIRGNESCPFYVSCASPEHDQVRLIHTTNSSHQLLFRRYATVGLSSCLAGGLIGLRPLNRGAFCRHSTGHSVFSTQRGAGGGVTRGKKLCAPFGAIRICIYVELPKPRKLCLVLPVQGRLNPRASFLHLPV